MLFSWVFNPICCKINKKIRCAGLFILKVVRLIVTLKSLVPSGALGSSDRKRANWRILFQASVENPLAPRGEHTAADHDLVMIMAFLAKFFTDSYWSNMEFQYNFFRLSPKSTSHWNDLTAPTVTTRLTYTDILNKFLSLISYTSVPVACKGLLVSPLLWPVITAVAPLISNLRVYLVVDYSHILG